MMRQLFGAIFCFFFVVATANAQTQKIYRYDANTIDSSIKCELGKVARLLAPSKPDPARMKVYISVNGEETITRKIGGGVGFFADIGASYERKTGRTRGAKGTRNISLDNAVNCRKSFVVDVGLLSCFTEQKDLFLAGQTITCSDSSTATSAANAGGKFVVWFVNASVSGELTNSRVWKFDVTAPPDK